MSDSRREVERDYNNSVGDRSFDISYETSFGDDVVFCVNDPIVVSSTEIVNQEPITISSTETSMVSKDDSQVTEDSMEITDSISEISGATTFGKSFDEADDRWSDARSRSGKRFERGTGLVYIKNGRFELKPVSDHT